MTKTRPDKSDPNDFTRVDSFRTDEDTGGAAAPPLRPREDIARENTQDETVKREKR